jgi:phosphatidylglycerol:prolipoprotein diacylglycerol transferase
MYPVIFTIRPFTLFGFDIGPLTLHTYGVVLALAFLAGLWITGRQARRAKLDPTRVTDLAIYALIAGLVGAKLLLLALDWRHYSAHPRELLSLFQSAGVFYGGLLGAIPLAWWYTARHKLPIWPVLDVLAPGLALAQSIGRWGCLAAGCCYGKFCSLPWAVVFPAQNVRNLDTPPGKPLHPTQIYESFATLAIFLTLIWFARRKRFHGQITAIYLLLYAAARFAIEYFRGDSARGFVFGRLFSTSQLIALIILLGTLALWPYLRKRQRIESGAVA